MGNVKDVKLKVGIAGYGVVGKRRRQYIDSHPYLKTTAVCDQVFHNPDVVLDGVRCFADYRKLLDEPLDVLFVSLPNYLAPEVTIAGLKKGLHVFCEKPPARDMVDMANLVKEKKKHPQLKLKYGFNHRYHGSVKDALKIVEAKQLGGIVNMRGVYGKSSVVPFDENWRSKRQYAGGGILLDQGIHMVDLMRLFNKKDFIEIKSFVSNKFWKHDVEDNVYALMKDSTGVFAILHSSATQWQHRFSLEINMSKGYLGLQGILSGTKSYGEEKLIIGRRTESKTGTSREEERTYLQDNSWSDEIHEFADAIIHPQKVFSGTVEDAYETMRLVYKIYQADVNWRKAFNLKKGV